MWIEDALLEVVFEQLVAHGDVSGGEGTEAGGEWRVGQAVEARHAGLGEAGAQVREADVDELQHKVSGGDGETARALSGLRERCQ